MQVLILDNDLKYANEVKEILQQKGFEIFLMDNPLEALVFLNNNKPHLIITEINLPGINGFKFMEEVKSEEGISNIPIIILSVFSRDEDRTKCKELGAADFISKNESLEYISDRVSKITANINQAQKLFVNEVSLSGKLKEISVPDVLQIIQMSRKTGKIEFNNYSEKGEVCILKGDLFAARIKDIEGEPALFTIFSWKSGDFSFTPFSSLVSKDYCKNLNISMHSAILNATKLIDEIEDTLKLTPYKRSNELIESNDVDKQFYFNLIDNKSTIYDLIEKHGLNKFVTVYYYLKLEAEKKCKIIEKQYIPSKKYDFEKNEKRKLKVLVVDDSKMMVKAVENILKEEKTIKEIDKAYSGIEALEKIKASKPDVITLDVNMPGMDGLTTLKHIMISSPIPVMMLSAFTTETSVTTFDALRFGAVDFHTKPVKKDPGSFLKQKVEIIEKVKKTAEINVHGIQHIQLKNYQREKITNTASPDNLIIIGAASGSYGSLLQILPKLSNNLNAAIVVLHYIDNQFINPFIEYLNKVSELNYKLCSNNESIKNGFCYFLPFDKYSKLEKENEQMLIHTNDSPFEKTHEHKINIGMFSAAETFMENCTGVLVSGQSEDGAEGLREIKRNNGYTIVQNPATCIMPAGPIAALKINAAMEVVESDRITNKLIEHIQGKM